MIAKSLLIIWLIALFTWAGYEDYKNGICLFCRDAIKTEIRAGHARACEIRRG